MRREGDELGSIDFVLLVRISKLSDPGSRRSVFEVPDKDELSSWFEDSCDLSYGGGGVVAYPMERLRRRKYISSIPRISPSHLIGQKA
jgi:hypothetical protein